jgi:type II secretory pathway pseudopilin PulG
VRKLQRERAFLLVMVLFLITILSVMGCGFLESRASQYQSTGKSVLAAQARALAMAGIEDARAKLATDVGFPPVQGANQNLFTYKETMLDSTNTTTVGSYTVTVDSTNVGLAPYFLLAITSVGQTTTGTSSLTSTHTYRAYVDVSPIVVPAPSPTYFQIVNFVDLGGI